MNFYHLIGYMWLYTFHLTHIQGIALATMMEALIREHPRFEIPAERYLGMVVFRLKVSIPL